MTDTDVADRTETTIAPEAPAPQLPAVVRQERRPRLPKAPVAPQYPVAIARAILEVSSEIGEVVKEGENTFQHYRYARWEDVNAKLSPLLAAKGLVIVQSEINRSLLEQNDKGSVLAIVYNFTLISRDGDQWPPVEWTGIARLRDSKGVTDDKAATKCHTQAEKYFCIKQFKIRVAEENPADRSHTLPKKDAREVYKALQSEIDEAQNVVELSGWGKDPANIKRKMTLPHDWQDIITTRYKEKLAELQGGPKVVWDKDEMRGFDEYDEETGEVK